MLLDFADLSKGNAYQFITHSIIPRPVAWVLTRNENQSLNLAPYSYFQAIGSQPPTLMISVGNQRDGTKKDTALNIEREGDFVIHIANTSLAEAVNLSAKTLPHGESEVELCQLDAEAVEGWPLRRLKDAPVAFWCRLSAVQVIAGMNVIFGEIRSVWADDDILMPGPREGSPDVPDPAKLDPIARLGGLSYASLGKTFDLERPG